MWKILEAEYPRLSMMARDLLCIPLAGVGVERCFNYARDMCHYRRGQLAPETIRALMLVYFSQITENRADELHQSLSSTMDISTMSFEEMEEEIQNREAEIGLRQAQVDDWDQDHYISDEEPTPHGQARTVRMQKRTEFELRRRRRRLGLNPRVHSQQLSVFEEEQRQERRQQAFIQGEKDRLNPGIYDVPADDVPLNDTSADDASEELNYPDGNSSRSLESEDERPVFPRMSSRQTRPSTKVRELMDTPALGRRKRSIEDQFSKRHRKK